MNKDTIEKLALIVAEKSAPDRSPEELAAQVLSAYKIALKYLDDNQEPSAFEEHGLLSV